jgi:hypothetical protein
MTERPSEPLRPGPCHCRRRRGPPPAHAPVRRSTRRSSCPARMPPTPPSEPTAWPQTSAMAGPRTRPGRRSSGRRGLGGRSGAVFASGMAAISAALAVLPAGGALVAPRDALQHRPARSSARSRPRAREVRRVDVLDTAAVVAALDGAGAIWLESPTNPLMEVADLPRDHAAPASAGSSSCATTPSPLPCSSGRSPSAPTSSSTRRRSTSPGTPTCSSGHVTRSDRRRGPNPWYAALLRPPHPARRDRRASRGLAGAARHTHPACALQARVRERRRARPAARRPPRRDPGALPRVGGHARHRGASASARMPSGWQPRAKCGWGRRASGGRVAHRATPALSGRVAARP